mmetsp:Transcript_38064/g.95685  ORF Transcript_38064/g.95685 Transcript_38064/m.95685 type:complete len:217 (+) Transcript_38064:135-785(+)
MRAVGLYGTYGGSVIQVKRGEGGGGTAACSLRGLCPQCTGGLLSDGLLEDVLQDVVLEVVCLQVAHLLVHRPQDADGADEALRHDGRQAADVEPLVPLHPLGALPECVGKGAQDALLQGQRAGPASVGDALHLDLPPSGAIFPLARLGDDLQGAQRVDAAVRHGDEGQPRAARDVVRLHGEGQREAGREGHGAAPLPDPHHQLPKLRHLRRRRLLG